MRKVIYSAALVALLLAGCGNEEKTEAQPEAKPKVEETVAKEAKPVDDEEALKAATETVEEDHFIKYRGAEWQGEYDNGGLTFKIHGVSVTNDIGKAYNVQANPGHKAVQIWFELENTTADKKYEVYPDQATLVTSTGEQVKPDPFLTNHKIAGEVYEGVTKEGDIIFALENTEDVADIESVKLVFNAYSENGENAKEFEVDLQLK
ncbi:hypothetical protein BAOM_4590 [Peribacillus asahii]|uniref:DUF4352 domain-containing protein n=1 Tax=Peribacillus asahii TaxID=228899 RepID=A0A3T0KXW9_9BACI|nr:hypothetical protein [Peribacillus asahii]AZV45169.1 hypothetical protein BAOM_4590 [Peribacillus asahii]